MALIFDIKRFAMNDGPGIRVTFFMKGCPLRCVWCHNPEGLESVRQKMYIKKKCIGCRSCVEACPQGALQLTSKGIVPTENECVLCGKCVDECPTLALEMAGREYGADELVAIAEKDRAVIEQSGGGVTICGGEPLMHPDATVEILKALGENGFHRAVDTTLYASAQTVARILPHCELLLVDLKHTDSEVHKRFTGVGNEVILRNIRLIAEEGANYWIRIPLIEGGNSDDANILRSAEFLAALPKLPDMVCLLPYHDIGRGKHERLGTTYNPQSFPFSTPSEETQEHCLEVFRSHGLQVRIGG